MGLIRCRDCKKGISKRAKACPHCGAVPRRTSGCTWLFLILFLVFIVFPMMFSRKLGSSGSSSSPNSYEPTPYQPTSPAYTPAPTPEIPPPVTPPTYQTKANASVIPKAKRAVRALLNDPDSAQFKDVDFAWSEKTGNVALGWVNSKNALGGYTGYQRFVANETTVFLEEREEERTLAAWREAMGGRLTEESIALMPQDTATPVPLVFDVKTVVSKAPAEVTKLLGKPNETKKGKYGTTYFYQVPDIEILFMDGKANLITVNGLDSIPFSPAAIQALGFPASNPTFANKEITMRWEPASPSIKRVQISRGKDNCDFATISVNGWPDEK